MGAKRSSKQQNMAAQIAILSDLISADVESHLRKVGHSLSTFQLLSAIKVAGPNITQAELANRLGITAASLCEALKTASQKGLIEQQQAQNDKRAKRVLLTNQGSKLIDQTLVRLENVNDRMLQGLGSKELSDMESVLAQCIDNLANEGHG